MNMTEKIQTYLNDPKIVSVNTVDAHSDHKYFESKKLTDHRAAVDFCRFL